MIELGIATVSPQENRASATDVFVDVLMGRARDAIKHALGALQISSGLVARALTTATSEGDMGLLTPQVLYQVGLDMIRSGESLWLLRVSPSGSARLIRAASSIVRGGPDPSGWSYRLTLAGPTQQTTVEAAASSVCHFRINCLALTPWRGRSALELASSTGRLAQALSGSLGDEAAISVSRILAIPQGSGKNTIDELKAAISNPSQGRIALPETTRGGGGGGQGVAPQRDWRSERLGWDSPTSAVDMYKVLLMEVGSIVGIPWPLLPGSEAAGPAIREANRSFLSTVTAIGILVSSELGRVIEQDVSMSHAALAAADVVARSRALKGLVDASIPLEEAKGLVGW